MLPVNLYIRRQIMKRKVILLLLIVVIAVTAVSFTACDNEGEYADLVGIRVNGRMAEWEDISYNFSYEGEGVLNVSVPYTNYLEITDLILSPGATGIVYSDKEYSQKIEDTSKIHTDGDKTLYIRVENGKTSHDYAVNVKVSNENLPEGDLSAKDYDNRGGHVYIPENAETVTVDGVEYNVIWGTKEESGYGFNPSKIKGNSILARDLIFYNYSVGSKDDAYANVFDGNGYTITLDGDVSTIFYTLAESGVFRNAYISRNPYYDNSVNTIYNYLGQIAIYNSGTIDNVHYDCEISVWSLDRYYIERGGYAIGRVGIYTSENSGTIKNCINYGSLLSGFREGGKYCLEAGVFASYSKGATYENCINMGNMENFVVDASWVYGVYTTSFFADENTSVKGVYNLGNVETEEKYYDSYNGFFGEIYMNKSIDLSTTRDYTKK